MRIQLSIATIIAALSMSGCFALIPYVQPDEQALSNGVCVPCQRQAAEREARAYYSPMRKLPASSPDGRVAKLLRQLESPKSVNRAHAAFWLGEMGPGADDAVPVLISHLTEKDKWVRRACAKALGKIGDSRAKKPLQMAANDHDPFVSESARNALARLN